MPGRIEKSRGPEDDPHKRKRESDSTKENQGNASKKKLSSYELSLKIQQYHDEQKAVSRQALPEIAPEKSHEPLGDTIKTVKPFSESDLKPKPVEKTLGLNKGQEDIVLGAAFHRNDPLSLDLMRELQHKHQDTTRSSLYDKKQI